MRALPVARIAEICLAWQNVVCRSCGDVCEPQAIRFRPRLGGAARPEVADVACTGCGDCVAACPVSAISLAPEAAARDVS